MKKNNSDKAIADNVEYSTRKLPLRWLNDGLCVFKGEVAIIGGAPSVKDRLEEIKKLPKDTMILSVNGTHDWLIENGVTPDLFVALDSRPLNDFANKPQQDCVYFLASQCHKSMFSKLQDFNVVLWHCEDEDLDKDMIAKESVKRNILSNLLISGKGSVALTSMCLAYTLGFREFKLFGMDSSFEKEQHIYKQSQNDNDKLIKFKYNSKIYTTTPNLAGQLFTFIEMQPLFEDCKIDICSDGMIKDINASNIAQLKEVDNEPKASSRPDNKTD